MPADSELEALRYPIGRYQEQPDADERTVRGWIDAIAALPDAVTGAVAGLTEPELDMPYRPGGWTIRQVVHHLADAHMNAFIRFKLALTEDRPQVKPYEESLWAETLDSRTYDIAPSLAILAGVQDRWAALLRSMTADDLQRIYMHPAKGEQVLRDVLGFYAWHGRHHLGHIQQAVKRVSVAG